MDSGQYLQLETRSLFHENPVVQERSFVPLGEVHSVEEEVEKR
jgi:hypothetical protein